MLLPLQKGVLYGPVDSRRYGKSLGINLLPPHYKLCSFDCVYCHYGSTKICTMDAGKYERDLPNFEKVTGELEKTLQSPIEFDLITFSGNGEPTLYPRFAEMVDAVVELRDKYRPKTKVALLSNSTGLMREEVRNAIRKLDLPILKLDAGSDAAFQAVNQPDDSVHFDFIVKHLSAIKPVFIQTVLIGGSPTNTSLRDLRLYFELLSRIQPEEVHLYSIDRPVPNKQISLMNPEKLEELAFRIKHELNIEARPFYSGQKK